MSEALQITDLQLAILQILWEQGEATVGEVHDALARHRDLAHSTVATLLARLKKRGVVSREGDRRRYIYRPLVSLDDVRESMVAELTDLLFSGDPVGLMAHVAGSGAITLEDRFFLRSLFPVEEDGRAPPPASTEER